MSLNGTVRKGLAIAQKFAEKLQDPKAASTPASTVGKMIQRITARITALTPLMAPAVTFVESSGFVAGIGFDGFWRGFEVVVLSQSQGASSRSSTGISHSVDLAIEVTYPEFPIVRVAGVNYSVQEVKAEDARLIDQLLMGGDLFTSPTDLNISAGVMRFGGFTDANGMKRRGRYIFEAVEVYP
jgi:hypothetical protein